jgi:hypothetical protein
MDPERRSSAQDLGDRAEASQDVRGRAGDSRDLGDRAGGSPDLPDRAGGSADLGDRAEGATAPGAAGAGDSSAGAAEAAGGGASMIQPDAAPEPGLLSSADETRFRQSWRELQARFVDDPQEAVRGADALVTAVIQALSERFTEHKGRLESHWRRGDEPDTEELRQALQRYRDFFDRLLAT